MSFDGKEKRLFPSKFHIKIEARKFSGVGGIREFIEVYRKPDTKPQQITIDSHREARSYLYVYRTPMLGDA